MLQAPEKYLNSILAKAKIGKDISILMRYFMKNCDKNIHFIIDEKELKPADTFCNLCYDLNSINSTFNFKVGQKVISLPNQNGVFRISTLHPNPTLKNDTSTVSPKNLNKYIPLSNSSIYQIGQ